MTARSAANPYSVLIEFSSDQVSVCGPGPAFQHATETRFRPMLAATSGHIVGRVVVHREDEVRHRVVVDDQADAEICSVTDLMPVVNRAVVTAFIRARPDLVWLHAGAVQLDGRALAVVGPWGHGKSTIATSLLKRGWTYLSDDVAPFDPSNLAIHPFPEVPRVRQGPGTLLDRESVATLHKVDVGLSDAAIARTPATCAGLIFPVYQSEGPNRFSLCPPSRAALLVLEGCLSFAHHREAALRFAASLAQTVPAFHLSYSDVESAADELTTMFAASQAERPAAIGVEGSHER